MGKWHSFHDMDTQLVERKFLYPLPEGNKRRSMALINLEYCIYLEYDGEHIVERKGALLPVTSEEIPYHLEGPIYIQPQSSERSSFDYQKIDLSWCNIKYTLGEKQGVYITSASPSLSLKDSEEKYIANFVIKDESFDKFVQGYYKHMTLRGYLTCLTATLLPGDVDKTIFEQFIKSALEANPEFKRLSRAHSDFCKEDVINQEEPHSPEKTKR